MLGWIKSCYIERYSPLDLFEPASGFIRFPQHLVHRGFLTGVLADVDECLNNYEAEKKVELVKWHTVLKEQLDKILPLDDEIYAELIADEKSTKDIMVEIDRAARLKADVLQKLAAIDEILTVPQPAGLSESENMSWSPSSTLNQNGVANRATSSSANSKTVRVKLPKLEVRKFGGKLDEWQEFWDSFESAIHSKDSLSNVDKFLYLRGLLLEPARSAIAGFALTSANYEGAVELLNKRFGKRTAIQRTLVNELLNTRPVFNESNTARLRGFYDLVEAKYRALQALDVDERTYSEIVIPMLLERIPDSIRLTITRGKQYLEWTLKDLLDSLLTEVELQEDHNLNVQRGGSNDSRKGPKTASALSTNKGGDKRCEFCLGGHPPEDCKKVQDIKEHRKLYLNSVKCFNCIEKGHRSRDCRVTIECKLCKGQHSSCLCVAKPQQASEGGGGGGIKIDQQEVIAIGPEIMSAPNLWVRKVG